MKTAIFEDRVLSDKLRRMGRKTKSHGSFRMKRKPNSKKVRSSRKESLYR